MARSGRLVLRIFTFLTHVETFAIGAEEVRVDVVAGAGRVLHGSTSRRDGLADSGGRCARLRDFTHGIVLAWRRVLVGHELVLVTEVHVIHTAAHRFQMSIVLSGIRSVLARDTVA